ncbi:HAMP domain-containing histidine kinase [Pedobacter sp. MC2016-14]|uniref:sensor histidine kinase n=1 Tax=Pedobacter sp. MC2016-14 TaxID=2897327 RepID=UPI001E4648E0|nr:HAMP domain-containing sensor histidine kinase [Pedobacter sp. MC2016-14]MCD0487044.1 HAMP domain-containing histidine kinase [Pedobacter sp. MC2016-14]
MKKRSFWFITALMTIALLGVVVMQLYYIREAYRLNSQLFEQNVNHALTAVVNKIQRIDAADHINNKDFEIGIKRRQELRNQDILVSRLLESQKTEERKRKQRQQKMISDNLNTQDSIIRSNFFNPSLLSESEFVAIGDQSTTPLNVDVSIGVDAEFHMTGGTVRKTIRLIKTKTFNVRPDKMPDSIRYLAYSMADGRPVKISVATVDADLAAKFKREDELSKRRNEQALKQLQTDTLGRFDAGNLNVVEEVFKEMRQAKVPLAQRISPGALDGLIKEELMNKNINLKYDFWVKLANSDSLLFKKVFNPNAEVLPANVFKTRLFNNSIVRDPGMIYISFPDKNAAIFGGLSVTLASSAGLLLVLVFIFSYTLYTILQQKKISEMKTDFINNMTHEFKTPVSTIMIASEALKDPEISEDKARITRLAGIIYDENVRLGNHIERVLSIARLEKKELQLEHNPVDINELVLAVVDSMQLQLQKKDAVIALELDAENPVIWGDELHLSNVIYNLVDNANKYSPGQPVIKVSTRVVGKKLVIEVADQGIGMTKDQTKRIFDQFYRVPTGNLHDVKGFGLGLNYVQDIVIQMNGVVKVHSEKDKGTVFEITLALK